MAANGREARRRKIMERGSDRLALITGRMQSLPPSSDLLPPSQSRTLDANADADAAAAASSSSQPLISNDHAPRTHVSYPNTTFSFHGEVEEPDSVLLEHDATSDPYHSNAFDTRSPTPPLHQCEDNNEISESPNSEDEQVELPPDLFLDTAATGQRSQLQIQEPKFFTPSEISSAITASESTRLCCSVAVALLVILSYIGFPLLGIQFMKSIISFRPLYLVLVTSVTVVVARLLTGKLRGSARAVGRQTSPDGDHWAEHLGRALEAGLVMRNVMDAMFMDCAIYAIIVICGLSLVQI